MLTGIIAEFVARSRYADLGPSAVSAAKRGVLDCIAVTLAGKDEDVARIVNDRVREIGGRAEATVIGAGFKTGAALAAYANGTMAHALDYDDVIHVGSAWLGHPSVVVLPAVLAVAELIGASGEDLVLAYGLGIELYAHIGLICGDKPYKDGWHNTAYIGTMAAAGAAARLLELDVPSVARAFGIAASMAGGLRQNFGSMTKPLHAGIAARNGVEAALLARDGLTADEHILEATLGFRNVFTAERVDMSKTAPYGQQTITLDDFAARLGAPWMIATPGLAFKICPSCRATHFGMEAALNFRQAHPNGAPAITEVEAHVPSHMGGVLFHHDPQTGLEGKFSLEYVLARTVLDGPPKIGDFTDERVTEPDVRALIKKVRWMPFEPPAGAFGTPEYVFKLEDGAEFRSAVDYPRGEPENPVADQVLVDKFDDCAGAALGPSARDQVRDLTLGLESLADIGELTGLLAASA